MPDATNRRDESPKRYKVAEDGSIPVLFCERQKKWLPMEEHVDCEFCAGPVYDEAGNPVSFLCTHEGARRDFQPDWEDQGEIGRGAPPPSADADEEE